MWFESASSRATRTSTEEESALLPAGSHPPWTAATAKKLKIVAIFILANFHKRKAVITKINHSGGATIMVIVIASLLWSVHFHVSETPTGMLYLDSYEIGAVT